MNEIVDKQVKIYNETDFELPDYATQDSAGLDLQAWLEDDVRLEPMERKLIPTGLRIALPSGYEAQIRPRSGLALKHGITVLNAPGTIDADYRGEIGVILVNLSNEAFYIHNGDRIAQMVVAKYTTIGWSVYKDLDRFRNDNISERGINGFGSTGV